MEADVAAIIEDWARGRNAPTHLINQGGLVHPARGQANGATPQVPAEERHPRTVIIPEVPGLIKLFIGLGAAPVTDDIVKVGRNNMRYRQFELPPTMRTEGSRYSRVGEFTTTSGEHVHGWRPGTIYAPDNSVLAILNDLGGNSTCVIGRTWSGVVDVLSSNSEYTEIPQEAIYAQGVLGKFPLENFWEKVLNGAPVVGQMQYEEKVKSAFLKINRAVHDEWVAQAAEVYGINSQDFKNAYDQFLSDEMLAFVEEKGLPLDDFSSARADRFLEFIEATRPTIVEAPDIDAPVIEITKHL